MVRTQIYITEEEQKELRLIAQKTGARQSEIIRQAIDHFIAQYQYRNRKQLLRQAKGIWKNRGDLPNFEQLRGEWDREEA